MENFCLAARLLGTWQLFEKKHFLSPMNRTARKEHKNPLWLGKVGPIYSMENLVWISGNFQWQMVQHFPKFRKRWQPGDVYRNLRKFHSKSFRFIWFTSRNFGNFCLNRLHSGNSTIFDFPELNQEISVPFAPISKFVDFFCIDISLQGWFLHLLCVWKPYTSFIH